jgi:WS/DGAT/MGAT family acyltransferase
LVDRDGRFRIEVAREAIGSRLPVVPRFRQVIQVPGPVLGRPLWVDVPRVDLERHVRVADARGDLLPAVERIRRRPLDRTRPLWEIWFLTGLPDGRVGCFVRAHHAIADGVGGMATLADLLGRDRPAPAATARAVASAPVLFLDNLRSRWQSLIGVAPHAGHPRATLRALRDAWPSLREIVAGEPAPRTSLNRPIGPRRTLAVVREDLDHVKKFAHAHAVTVNDVLLAAVAGGLRDLLWGRGEPVEDGALRAFVPVALGRARPSGNRTGEMLVPLPVGVADPSSRLRLIAAETAVRRRMSHPSGATLFPNAVVQKTFLKRMARQRWANTYVANVPGPTEPLHIAGSPVLELYPLVPLIGNVTLGVGALSYAGQFNITVVADADACPDVDVFTEGLRASLAVTSGDVVHRDDGGGTTGTSVPGRT